MVLAIVTNPSTWEEDRSQGGFFGDTFDTGTAGSTKAIFYGSAAVAGATLIWSVLDAMSVAKDSEVRPPRYNYNLQPMLTPGNKGAMFRAQIRF